jgi:hypothetical protein
VAMDVVVGVEKGAVVIVDVTWWCVWCVCGVVVWQSSTENTNPKKRSTWHDATTS